LAAATTAAQEAVDGAVAPVLAAGRVAGVSHIARALWRYAGVHTLATARRARDREQGNTCGAYHEGAEFSQQAAPGGALREAA